MPSASLGKSPYVLKNYRWVVVALLLFIAGSINYMDRAAIGVVAPFIQKSFTLSPSQLGVAFSTFFIGYAVFAFVGGQLADRFGPVRTYVWAATGWSVLCGLTGVVTGYAQLLIVRTLFGFAEGPMNSTTNRTISNWFPRRETARAVGFTFSGQTFGSAVAAPIVAFIALKTSWRVSFIMLAVLGLIWVLAWRFLVTDLPQKNPRVSKDELLFLENSREPFAEPPGGVYPSLVNYLKRASTLSLGLGMFAVNYTLYIFISWLPTYLTDALHMSAAQMAVVASIPWMAGLVGYLGGGILSDFIYNRSADKLQARKITTIAPLAIAGVALLLVTITRAPSVDVALISVAIMLLTASVQSCWSTIRELVPPVRVGGVGGFVHLLSNISGIVGPTATGFAIQYLGGFDSAFFLASGAAAAGVIAMAICVRRNEDTPTFTREKYA
jgi:ACS family hexuronate transporter-like MFS transporter